MSKFSVPSLRYVPPGEGFREQDPSVQYPDFSVTWHWGDPGTIFITRIDRSTYGCVKVIRRLSVRGMNREEAELRANEMAILHRLLTPLAKLRSRIEKDKGWPKR